MTTEDNSLVDVEMGFTYQAMQNYRDAKFGGDDINFQEWLHGNPENISKIQRDAQKLEEDHLISKLMAVDPDDREAMTKVRNSYIGLLSKPGEFLKTAESGMKSVTSTFEEGKKLWELTQKSKTIDADTGKKSKNILYAFAKQGFKGDDLYKEIEKIDRMSDKAAYDSVNKRYNWVERNLGITKKTDDASKLQLYSKTSTKKSKLSDIGEDVKMEFEVRRQKQKKLEELEARKETLQLELAKIPLENKKGQEVYEAAIKKLEESKKQYKITDEPGTKKKEIDENQKKKIKEKEEEIKNIIKSKDEIKVMKGMGIKEKIKKLEEAELKIGATELQIEGLKKGEKPDILENAKKEYLGNKEKIDNAVTGASEWGQKLLNLGLTTLIILIIVLVIVVVILLGTIQAIVGGLWAMSLMLKLNPHIKGVTRYYMMLYAFTLSWIYVVYVGFRYGWRMLIA